MLKRMTPLMLSRTGAVKTSPSGMLRSPKQDHRDVFDRELELRAGGDDLHLVGRFHPLLQRQLRLLHRHVVGRADVEVEVFERGGAHVRRLSERVGRVAEDDPLRLRDANLAVDGVPPILLVEVHPLLRHVGMLAAVGGATDADVRLGRVHAVLLEPGGRFHALLVAVR